MSNKFLPSACLLALIMLLAGCSTSPPNNYYLLSAHTFPAPGGVTPAVGVGPIRIPEYLSRQNLVYTRVDNRLQVASLDLWAEPLGDGIQRVLVINLTGLLNSQSVSFFPWHPERAPEFGVEVNVLQLEATEQQALLTAEWLVYRPPNAGSINRRIARLQLPLPPGPAQPEQVAAAYSTLLFQLSETIAAAIQSDRGAATTPVTP